MKQEKIYSIYSIGEGGFDLTFNILFTTLNKLEAFEVLKNRTLKAKKGEKVYLTDKPFKFKKDKHPELLKRVIESEKKYNPFMMVCKVFAD